MGIKTYTVFVCDYCGLEAHNCADLPKDWGKVTWENRAILDLHPAPSTVAGSRILCASCFSDLVDHYSVDRDEQQHAS